MPVKSDKIFTQDGKNATLFLSNPVNILKIPEFAEVNPFAEKVAILSDIESNFQVY